MTFLIRATHPAGFRSGEWAVVEGVVWRGTGLGRPCYRVRFIDGRTDTWPIYDPSDPYEFKPMEPEPVSFFGPMCTCQVTSSGLVPTTINCPVHGSWTPTVTG